MATQAEINSYLFKYRLIILIYMVFWWLESMKRFYELNKIWPIMFTHWTTSMQIIDLFHKYLKHKSWLKTGKVEQEQQSVLSKLTFASSILVTVLFWLLVLPAKKRLDPKYEITIGEVHAHGINVLVCVFENFYFFLLNFNKLTEKSFYSNLKLINYKKPFIGLQVYISSYFLFSFIYWLFDKKNNIVYEAMNFNNPKNAIFISSFIFFIISPLFIYTAFLFEFIIKNAFMKIFLKIQKSN